MKELKNHEKIKEEMKEKLNYTDLLNCMRCGMCVNSCPTYRTFSKEEANSPRGRVALMRAVYEDKLTPDEDFKRAINNCVTCKKCVEACPSRVKYIELLKTTRNILDNN